MTRGVRWYLVGSLVLVALTGCKPTWVEDREPWRREAEMACLKTGAVKESPSVALLQPISGPGMCGADFPLKISGLGEESPLGYADEALRPPGDVQQSGPSYPPQGYPQSYPPQPPYQAPSQYPQRYPSQSPYPSNPPFAVNPNYPADTRLPPRNEGGGSGYQVPSQRTPSNTPFAVNPDYPADTRLPPRNEGGAPGYQMPSRDYEPAPPAYPGAAREPQFEPPGPHQGGGDSNGPVSLSPPGYEAPAGDRAGDYQAPLPRYSAPRTVPARQPTRAAPPPSSDDEPLFAPGRMDHTPPFTPRPGSGEVVPMSPSRMAAVPTTASVSPPATLACPIVSTLDRWISEAVQPAAQKWFGQPVTGIKQISAYSCRGMNGDPNAHISEHAFGNALDIAAFVLADGRVVTVEKGWHGAPEEQGFLHDVQGAACELFTTVLAPGSNAYHYNHIHVDLMRRASGRRICEPGAVSGDVVAARVRGHYAGNHDGITGSIPASHGARRVPYSAYGNEDRNLPDAVPGED